MYSTLTYLKVLYLRPLLVALPLISFLLLFGPISGLSKIPFLFLSKRIRRQMDLSSRKGRIPSSVPIRDAKVSVPGARSLRSHNSLGTVPMEALTVPCRASLQYCLLYCTLLQLLYLNPATASAALLLYGGLNMPGWYSCVAYLLLLPHSLVHVVFPFLPIHFFSRPRFWPYRHTYSASRRTSDIPSSLINEGTAEPTSKETPLLPSDIG